MVVDGITLFAEKAAKSPEFSWLGSDRFGLNLSHK